MIYEVRYDPDRVNSILTIEEVLYLERGLKIAYSISVLSVCLWDPEAEKFLDREEAISFIRTMNVQQWNDAISAMTQQEKLADAFQTFTFGGNKHEEK